jgi:hypothetical protein
VGAVGLAQFRGAATSSATVSPMYRQAVTVPTLNPAASSANVSLAHVSHHQ